MGKREDRMSKLLRRLKNWATKLYADIGNNSLKQGENLAKDGEGFVPEERKALFRRAAAEGAVLLKNEGTLPFCGKVALFGRVQTDTFYTGYGSGGDVIKPYRVSIQQGLSDCDKISLCEELAAAYREFSLQNPVDHGYWGNWPRHFEEMPLSEELLDRAARETNRAVVVIGRAAGEERENELLPGSYYLTEEEKTLLSQVAARFEKVAVVLNIGNVIDLSPIVGLGDRVGAILLIWQGGMETGNALADLISGKVSPCGKLTDTIATDYASYPSSAHFGGETFNEYYEDIYVGYRYFETFRKEKVLYPFGFGLSYTKFATHVTGFGEDGQFSVRVSVKNIGGADGREVVQTYVEKPNGILGNPKRALVAFAKTALLKPGQEEIVELRCDRSDLVCYDDSGESGYKNAFVLLKGKYTFYVGTDVRSAQPVLSYYQEETQLWEQTENLLPPSDMVVMCGKNGELGERTVHADPSDRKERMRKSIPPEHTMSKNKPTMSDGREILFSDVVENRATMSDFVAQFTLEELEAISRGDYTMDSPLGAKGNAGAFGGVTESLRRRGVPVVVTTDGPSGIRLKTPSSLLPVGTALASSFDPRLVEEVYREVGIEMKERGSDVLLAPGMNLHRDPLCGRNFEYFSEDPYLTGKIAAAVVRGLQKEGVSACPKHFACNNQETNRAHNDSRVSQRALRELYLKGFEICVKEASPHLLMTSYNKINGVWAHYHFDLCRGIVRGEWNFSGCIITDWWMRNAVCPEFKKLRVNAYRVRAGVNVLMPGGGYLGVRKPDGTLLRSLGKKEGIAMSELRRNAEEVLGFLVQREREKKGSETESCKDTR